MPRNYVRKTLKDPNQEAKLRFALNEVLSGRCTIRQAAEKTGLPKSTIAFYSKRHQAGGLLAPGQIKRLEHPTQILTALMETELADYLKEFSIINHGLSTKETREIAYSYSVANNIKIPISWIKNERASEDWCSGFIKRNKTISVRKPEPTSQARAAGFNKPVVMKFFDNLGMLMTKHQFKAHELWNCDETNDPTVNPPPKIIATKGTKQVQQTVSAERGVNVTMLAFINAGGGWVPPVFVFPWKKVAPTMFQNGPLGCIGLPHESGWMTGQNFFKSLQHFHSFVKCSKEKPILLIMDNHSSHLDFQAVTFAKENGIVMLTLPPHCSHVLQPLDVTLFGPFKKAIGSTQNDWINKNPGGRISIKEIAQLSRYPFESSFTPQKIIKGFEITGIYPYN
ncbi:uncharacterized protein LOC116927786 [Daphnia magna]|uniref:uncharacterized protein LOC116927786 n=1 Tax=Daphnia magna TaxID=35525 RepID=UPI001E1BCCDE|nr:uncharacterized protein LOC116927786 [Daphnia magna]